MKYNTLYGILCCLFFIQTSCSNNNNKHIVAKIGDEKVESSIVNKLVEKDIYEYLYNIYRIRLAATHEYLGVLLLKKAAEENNTSIDSIITFYANNHNAYGTDEEYLRQQLIDSLYTRYNAQIVLEEPIAPAMRIDQALIQTRGNENSKITLTEFSDFDCGMCSYMHKEYRSLYEKYGDRVKFVHSIFSSEVSPSAKAAYAAGLQGRYWEMSDTLFALTIAADSLTVMNIAMQMELDFDQFVFDYTSTENTRLLVENNTYLSNCGVLRTPTILINGHPLREPNNIDYIINHIENALDEVN